jgi:hypothetical protein
MKHEKRDAKKMVKNTSRNAPKCKSSLMQTDTFCGTESQAKPLWTKQVAARNTKKKKRERAGDTIHSHALMLCTILKGFSPSEESFENLPPLWTQACP